MRSYWCITVGCRGQKAAASHCTMPLLHRVGVRYTLLVPNRIAVDNDCGGRHSIPRLSLIFVTGCGRTAPSQCVGTSLSSFLCRHVSDDSAAASCSRLC